MKINILTLTGNDNFGNKLQHFALQKELQKLNNEVSSTFFYYSNKNLSIIKNFIKKFINKRYANFLKFDKKINYSKNYFNNNKMVIREDFDFYIVGSDQVWNPNFPYFNNYYLLENIDNNKRISYAASFGVNELPEKNKKIFQEELKKFKMISVREDRGKEIVENLTGRNDVEVVLDPTMLLCSKEWEELAIKPKNMINRRYILNYFLGKMSESRKKEIERIATENDCTIINILDPNDPFYESGPSEFLYLEKNAFLICTDSFHSSVFAFLFNRPFVVFERDDSNEKMNSRLDTLINKFNLKNRRHNEQNITKENLQHDYDESYKILENERDKSEKFLKKALGIEDD